MRPCLFYSFIVQIIANHFFCWPYRCIQIYSARMSATKLCMYICSSRRTTRPASGGLQAGVLVCITCWCHAGGWKRQRRLRERRGPSTGSTLGYSKYATLRIPGVDIAPAACDFLQADAGHASVTPVLSLQTAKVGLRLHTSGSDGVGWNILGMINSRSIHGPFLG